MRVLNIVNALSLLNHVSEKSWSCNSELHADAAMSLLNNVSDLLNTVNALSLLNHVSEKSWSCISELRQTLTPP
jgi:hypothetical protein